MKRANIGRINFNITCNHIESIKIEIKNIILKLEGHLNNHVSTKLKFNDGNKRFDSLTVKLNPGEIQKKDNITIYKWFSNPEKSKNDYLEVENVFIFLENY